MFNYERSDNLYFERTRGKPGTAIIFIHGIGGTHTYWPEEFKALKEFGTLYFVDTLGFGYSAKPKTEYTLANHVQAFQKFIEEHVSEKEIILVAHSTGTIIALGIANQLKVQHLFLLSLTAYQSKEEGLTILRTKYPDWLLEETFFWKHFSFVHPLFVRIARLFTPYFIKSLPKHIARDLMLTTPRSFYGTIQNVTLKPDVEKLITVAIAKKTTMMHGQKDTTCPYEEIKALATRNHVEFITIKDQGHNFPLYDSNKVVELIAKKLL